jgi:nucleotide-binding universal stress UspA family protein
MFKNLVVALDGSRSSAFAFDLALALANAEKSKLSICSVANPAPTYGTSAPTTLVEDMLEDIRGNAQRIVDDALATAKSAGIPAEGATQFGEPAIEIVRYANALQADAIVIGTHGRSGTDRLLMGSVAEGVLRASSIPVLVVRSSRS